MVEASAPMKNKCKTPFCRNRVTGKRTCNTCVSRTKRNKNPMRYAYDVLKMNAKRRGKDFTISFDYFKRFAILTNYVAGKGRNKLSFSVDRVDNRKGYVPGNLQMLTVSDNSRKAHRTTILNYDYETGFASVNRGGGEI